MVRDGIVPIGALVEAAIQRIEDIDPGLNSVTHRAFDHARTAVDRVDRAAPMAAVPALLKASLAYPGFPQTSCSRAKQHVIATKAWPFAERMDAAGLIAVGMSAMPEFGLLVSGEALLTGPALNPWNPAYTAGGSSTGAAIAVAAGLVPLAHASDAAGSIRVPAANCGVIGFKPSRGWNVRAREHHLIDDLLCNDSLIARSVRDIAWSLRMERPSGLPDDVTARRPMKIAVDLDGFSGGADPEVTVVIRRAAELCADLGHHIETVAMPIDRPALAAAIRILWPYLGGDLVDLFSALRPDEPLSDLLEPWTIGLAEKRRSIQPQQLAAAYAAIADAERSLTGFYDEWDVVLSPVTRHPPLAVGALAPTREFDGLWTTLFDYIDYTPLHNMIGTPSVSLPLGWTETGLPIGAMFSSAAGRDELLIALSNEIEQAAPWADRWPAAAMASPVARRPQYSA